jgi:tRNA-specific 2-thiouridylase
MSGGVDSSVAAALAVAVGLETVGVTMRLWGTEEMERGEGGCCSIDAVEDARRVCSRLGIPHYVLNMAEHFREMVVGDFLSRYSDGLTPNPCIRCNERVKFAELLRRVAAIGATHIASGHYARVEVEPDWEVSLRRGRDRRKDQSYTLYRSNSAVLSRLVLPLGLLQKPMVRRLAESLGLTVAHKPDSQDLCFVGGRDHREVLAEQLQGQFAPGPILSLGGEELGRHRGVPFYTVGQRQGLGLAVRRADSEPHYVVRVDPARNAVFVGPWRSLLRGSCLVSKCVYLSGSGGPRSGLAQLRAHGQAVEASWRPEGDTTATVSFADPQAAIAPGQSLVLYDGDRVVAGGEIAPDKEVEFP